MTVGRSPLDHKQSLKFLANYKFMCEIHKALIYALLEQQTKQYTEADIINARCMWTQ